MLEPAWMELIDMFVVIHLCNKCASSKGWSVANISMLFVFITRRWNMHRDASSSGLRDTYCC